MERMETGCSPVKGIEAVGTSGRRKLHLNIRERFFTVRETEHWHKLCREVLRSLSLEIFKSCLDVVLGAACSRWPPLEQRGWTR